MTKRRPIVIPVMLGAAVLLAILGCGGGGSGGGGGETLVVSISYGTGAHLFRPANIQPILTGFNGHSPQCSLKSGSVPPGMTLHPDCSVSGTPTQFGTFDFVVHLGASGVSNQLDWTLSLVVDAPQVDYTFADANPTYYPGDVVDTVNQADAAGGWDPWAGDTIVYSVESGALPPGLALDPATGGFQGTVEDAPGDYNCTIKVELQHGSEVVRTGGAVVYARVLVPTFSYPDAYPADVSVATCAWITEPFTLTPRLPRIPPGSTLAFALTATDPLPDGLALDVATGTISGTPTALSTTGARGYSVELTVTPPGSDPVVYGSGASLQICSPFYQYYLAATLPAAPIFLWRGPHPTGFSYAYGLPPGCAFVPGVSLDPTTGVISGARPPGSLFTTDHCLVQVTATRSGIQFVTNAGVD